MTQENMRSNNSNIVFSLINEQKINQFFENRKTLSLFLISEYQNDKTKFFQDIDLNKLYQEVKSMEDLIIKTNNSFSKNPSKSFNNEVSLCKKENDIMAIKNIYSNLNLEVFIDELIFSNVDKSIYILN